MTKAAPRRQFKEDRLTSPRSTAEEIQCDFALGPLDTATRAAERKWGVNRLADLVSIETAQKMGFSYAKLNEAVAATNAADTAAWAGVCIRGLAAMDAEATRLGHAPAPPEAWQIMVEGQLCAIIRDGSQWPALAAKMPGVRIYTLNEVAVALAAINTALVNSVKDAFPGATVSAIRPKQRTELEESLDDEIIF